MDDLEIELMKIIMEGRKARTVCHELGFSPEKTQIQVYVHTMMNGYLFDDVDEVTEVIQQVGEASPHLNEAAKIMGGAIQKFNQDPVYRKEVLEEYLKFVKPRINDCQLAES